MTVFIHITTTDVGMVLLDSISINEDLLQHIFMEQNSVNFPINLHYSARKL